MTWVVYSIRLLTELVLLLAVALGAAELASGTASLAVVLLAVLTAGGIWGTWVAPRARHRLPDPLRFGVEVAMFVWGGAGFAISGRPGFGVTLTLVGIVAAAAIRWVGEPAPGADSAPRSPTR